MNRAVLVFAAAIVAGCFGGGEPIDREPGHCGSLPNGPRIAVMTSALYDDAGVSEGIHDVRRNESGGLTFVVSAGNATFSSSRIGMEVAEIVVQSDAIFANVTIWPTDVALAEKENPRLVVVIPSGVASGPVRIEACLQRYLDTGHFAPGGYDDARHFRFDFAG